MVSATLATGNGRRRQVQLDAITAQAATDNDPVLLAELPYAPGFLPTAPDPVKEKPLCRAGHPVRTPARKKQVTIRAVITGIVAALLADPRTGGENANEPSAQFDESNTAAIPQTANELARGHIRSRQGRGP
jgi:hypothetical protein